MYVIYYLTEKNLHCNSISAILIMVNLLIGHVNEYPTMHGFGISRHTQSMIAYKILTEYLWKFQ